MRLTELVAPFPVERLAGGAEGDPEVTGVAIDSRRAEPGDLFVAVAGESFDGRRFAADAVAAGAAAVLAAPGPVPDGAAGVPWLAAPSPRELAGPLAARAYGHPERELTLVAVTGTNGKSTTVALIAALLAAAGRPTALLGTLGYRFGELELAGERTTPEAPDLVRMLRRFAGSGARAAALEASSHALALHRLDGLVFDVTAFTNLSRDHLDFHGDAESYYRAKRLLFGLRKEGGAAVLNLDDAAGRRLAGEIGGRLVTYSVERPEADVRAADVRIEAGGMTGTVETPRGPLEVRSALVGRYNLENVLAAIAAAEALELPHAAIARGLAECRPVAGRLEPIDRGQPFPVYVDYAHTPAALEAALGALRELVEGRLIVVFGAGGDRDPGKRPEMGRVAGRLADLPVLTSDNPRTEDPLAIIGGLEEGVRASGNRAYRVVPDRREAIRRAVAVAGPGDAVLVAGKGHEEYQEIGGVKRPFSDRDELASALEEILGETARR